MKQINFEKKLKEVNLKATPARIAVLNFLEKTEEPIDANTIIEKINEQGIKTNPATIFRIMNILVGKGMVISIQFQEGKARYELAERKHHHHLFCDSCGRIEDIYASAIPALEKEIQKKQDFLIKRHSLEFFGLCKLCQR